MGAFDDGEQRIRDGLLALFDQLLPARRGRQPVPVGMGLAVGEQDGGPQRVPLAAVDEQRDDACPFLGADADERSRWPGNHRASRFRLWPGRVAAARKTRHTDGRSGGNDGDRGDAARRRHSEQTEPPSGWISMTLSAVASS